MLRKLGSRQGPTVLVKVHATTVCRTDCGQLRAHPFFMRLVTGVARPNHVVDYTRQDCTGIDETFDFVLDAVGKASYFQCRRLLTPQGVFATTDLGPHNQNALLGLWGTISRRWRVILGLPQDSRSLVEMLRARL
jgi:NADPH:quinone reductase-like Zn-dependent oxidoreductase